MVQGGVANVGGRACEDLRGERGVKLLLLRQCLRLLLTRLLSGRLLLRLPLLLLLRLLLLRLLLLRLLMLRRSAILLDKGSGG
jgi:hypothetical protein